MKGNQTIPVTVSILEIEWLSDHMKDLYIYMSQLEDTYLFENEFIKILLENQHYSGQVLWKVFTPYIIYAMTSIAYFSNHLISEQCIGFFASDYEGFGHPGAMRVIIVCIGLSFLCIEMVQMSYLKFGYFEDFWNLFMVSSVLCNVYLVFEHVYNFSNIHYDAMI